ncbi:MAG: CBS domain-containing protein [Thermoguttaceae bacterium]|jgi:CBS domain-containing protein
MTLVEILKAKGGKVHTTSPDTTLDEATRELVHHNVGSLLVCDRDPCEGEKLLGIITERDIIRFCASGKGPLTSAVVADIMTVTLHTGSPSDSVESVMSVMTTRRIRHLPVLSDGRLVGLVSIGDVVKTQLDHLAMENQFMKNYITS